MGINNAINKLYMLKKLKKEVNEDIKKNLDKMNMDEIEKFEFMHKIDKLDLIIEGVIEEIEKSNREEKVADINKEEIISIFKPKEKIKENDIEDLADSDTKKYIPTRLETKKKSIEKEEGTKVKADEMKSSIEMAYKRIEDLEKLINQRKLIEKEELFGNMKDIHSREERADMLKKRHIISESFTPKAKEQSDPEMQKTVAMSKEEFYKEVNDLAIEENIEKTPINMDHTMMMDKSDLEGKYNSNVHNEGKKNSSKEEASEYYDIYNEEKSSGIIEKFKDFLGK
ncbi:MAG: hypothetical protein ACRCWG_12275 [Sarcina sp.]